MAHPTWDMGPVITINSATLVNKGLEVIEAHLLFDIAFDRIDVVVHPQSVVHSMVEFVDGSTIAQASPPDMRLPIALGLAWPRPGARRRAGVRLDRPRRAGSSSRSTTRRSPPCALARRAGAAGGTAPAVLNAANEVCVDAFVAGDLPFLGIVDTVARCVEEHLLPTRDRVRSTADADASTTCSPPTRWARERARRRSTLGGRTDEERHGHADLHARRRRVPRRR